jgi:hypothetical protein
MGLRSLSEELASVLGRGPGAKTPACGGCGSLREMVGRMSRASRLSEEALIESFGCDKKCLDEQKGAPCGEAISNCCKRVKNPEALCAKGTDPEER